MDCKTFSGLGVLINQDSTLLVPGLGPSEYLAVLGPTPRQVDCLALHLDTARPDIERRLVQIKSEYG